MPQIFIHINAEPGKMWSIAEHALKVPGVSMAYAVTGMFDVIVYAELDDIRDYSHLIADIQSIDGVLKTQTSITIEPIERGIL